MEKSTHTAALTSDDSAALRDIVAAVRQLATALQQVPMAPLPVNAIMPLVVLIQLASSIEGPNAKAQKGKLESV